jgi:hypothetical protein
MGNGSEATSELIANYCNSVLLMFKSQEDSKEDSEEDGAQEWRNRILNPAIKFSDLVNEDRTSLTTSTMSIEELCRSVKMETVNNVVAATKMKVINPHFLLVKQSLGLKFTRGT